MSYHRDDTQPGYGSIDFPPTLDLPESQMPWDMSAEPFLATATTLSLSDSLLAVPGTYRASVDMVPTTFTVGAAAEVDRAQTVSLDTRTKERSLPNMTFHVRLPMSSPVAQQNATYILQMIRPFPNMMTRKDTLPPFIHHSLGSTDSGLAFPEPLANCMSIARMFVWRTSETREFVWETIWSEQRKLADKAASYTPEDLLASLQACNIYVIMRMVDYSPEHAEKDLETMLWCYRISDRLINSLDGEFGVSEHDRPNQMWKDWIFVESQRRYLSVWFLLTRLISMRTGIGCPYVDAYLSLPLPAPRSLWEAASAEAWKAEYDCTYTTPELPRLRTFGELVEAQKPTNYTQFMHKLDLWNADADSLGMMLTLATAIMK